MEDRFGGSLGIGDDKFPEAQIGPAGDGGAFVILGDDAERPRGPTVRDVFGPP